MSRMLQGITEGVQQKPLRVVLYGPEGVGKTTFAADAPAPIFLGPEDGSEELNVVRFRVPESLDDVLEAVALLSRGVPQLASRGTLVIDTLDALERLIFEAVVRDAGSDSVRSIEQVGGGYGKGYSRALDMWEQLLRRLDTLQAKRGTHVIMLAHAQLTKVTNPHGADYHRYELKLNAKAAGMVKEWARDVLFANFEVRVDDKKGELKKKGHATGKRLIFTAHSAGYDAKTRTTLPDKLPLSFAAFWEARQKASKAKGAQAAVDAALLAEVEAAVAQLPETLRVNTKGVSLVKLARQGGDPALRKLLNWAVCKLDDGEGIAPAAPSESAAHDTNEAAEVDHDADEGAALGEDVGGSLDESEIDADPSTSPGGSEEATADQDDVDAADEEGHGLDDVDEETSEPGDDPIGDQVEALQRGVTQQKPSASATPTKAVATAKPSAPAQSSPPTGSQRSAPSAGSIPAGASAGGAASAPKKAARKAVGKS